MPQSDGIGCSRLPPPTGTGSAQESGPAAPLGVMLDQHLRLQSELCRRLEALADHLPARVDAQECLLLARHVFPTIKRAHAFEEEIVFPVLIRASGRQPSLKKSLERLRFEHWEDEAFAGELSEALHQFVTDGAAVNPETLAYMLRGFFEGLRRHIAFEREHILPKLDTMEG